MFSRMVRIPISHLHQCRLNHPGWKLCLNGTGLLPETKNLPGNYIGWKTLRQLSKHETPWTQKPHGMAWRYFQVLADAEEAWWADDNPEDRVLSVATRDKQCEQQQFTSAIFCPNTAHSNPGGLSRAWKLIQTVFIRLIVAIQHTHPFRKRNTLVPLIPFRETTNRWTFKYQWKLQTQIAYLFVWICTWLTLQNVNHSLIIGPRLKWKSALHNEMQTLMSDKCTVSCNKNQELQPSQPPSLHKYQFSLFLLLAEAAWQWHATTLLVNTRYYKQRTKIITTVK